MRGISIAVVFAFLSAAMAGTSAEPRAQLRKILDAPMIVGDTKDSLSKTFGKLLSTREDDGGNGSTITTLKFDGAVATTLYAPNFGDKRALVRLKITRNFATVKLPISVGAPIDSVIKLLGPPQQKRKRTIEYVYALPESTPSGDRLIITVAEDRIGAIEWAPYLD
jgi:hypothetical protein